MDINWYGDDEYSESKKRYTETLVDALHKAGLTQAERTTTGGGCMAVAVVFGDCDEVLITDGDADLPSEYGMCAYYRNDAKDIEEEVILEVNPLHPDLLNATVDFLVREVVLRMPR